MKVTVTPHPSQPWFKELRFGFNKNAIAILKTLPGCRWDAVSKCWLVPVELYEKMKSGEIDLEAKPTEENQDVQG